MKILYISSLILKKASSASIRNVGLINGLIENGNQVDILTVNYPKQYRDNFLVNILSSDTTVYYSELKVVNKYLQNKNSINKVEKGKKLLNVMKNIAKTIYFFPDIDKEWVRSHNTDVFDKSYDLIISSSDTKTAHYVASNLMKKGNSKKWYQIWGDPWSDDINISKFNKKRATYMERKFISRANKVFYVSLPTAEAMKLKYPALSSKINYLGRSYLTKCRGRDIGIKNELIFTYTGSINENRNIFNLLNRIDVYNKYASKKIKFIIYGNVDSKFLHEAKKYSFLEVKGIVDFEKIQAIYSDSDVLVFIDNGGETSQIPGKLYDYFGTDRPILVLVDSLFSPISQFIMSTNRCIVKRNDFDSLEFDFINNLVRENILESYSGYQIAKKIVDKF